MYYKNVVTDADTEVRLKMGMYLNPGYVNFSGMLKSDIYVDKTGMLSVLNSFIKKEQKYICLSRPRRFGKTMAGNMICAYYSKNCDSRELFAPYEIARDPSFEEGLNKFNVIKIDVNGEYSIATEKELTISALTTKIRSEFISGFPDIVFTESDSIADCIQKVFAATGEQFVILMDEYDVLVREEVEESLFKEYLMFLNGLFKNDTLRPAIALAYLTGILPVFRDKVQSKLNNFREYTILNPGPFAEYTGFTTAEVKRLCEEYRMDFNECKNWYDGYRLSWNEGFEEKRCEIYNPESVVRSMLDRRFLNYWSATSNYSVISERLEQNFDGTKDAVQRMIVGEDVAVNVLRFKNVVNDFKSKDDVFTYLIHLGYLAYDFESATCRIPNNEVLLEWQGAVSEVADYSETDKIIENSRALLSATIEGNEKAVAEGLERAHLLVSSFRNYNNEYALHAAVYLAYMYALNKYICLKELPSGKGIADIVYIPVESAKRKNYPALIVELKLNKSASEAMKQIKEKRYFDALNNYTGEVLYVGINYDEETKTHECRIERHKKES